MVSDVTKLVLINNPSPLDFSLKTQNQGEDCTIHNKIGKEEDKKGE